jgi:hypothetical protein
MTRGFYCHNSQNPKTLAYVKAAPPEGNATRRVPNPEVPVLKSTILATK